MESEDYKFERQISSRERFFVSGGRRFLFFNSRAMVTNLTSRNPAGKLVEWRVPIQKFFNSSIELSMGEEYGGRGRRIDSFVRGNRVRERSSPRARVIDLPRSALYRSSNGGIP